jgi:D-sedoheptulose 7-phosphate isomerase
MNARDLMTTRLQAGVAMHEALLENAVVETVCRIADATVQALTRGHKVLLFGNGGSAADAQHLAAEFVGRFRNDRPGLPALALTVNSSVITALGNDYGFDKIFARQIEALGTPGDLVIGISTSGNAPNVIQGILTARAKAITTVGFTGHPGGRLKDIVDYCLCIPSADTGLIQEGHIVIGHTLCDIVEQALFGQEVAEPKADYAARSPS